MGREALIAAFCWFTIGEVFGVNSLWNDQSVSRLYRTLPSTGVYASGAPYGAFSFQVPLITAPNTVNARVIPIKEQPYSFNNMNAYLKDSYGNRFVESKQSPNTMPFKPFPQQYVQLPELPAHFTQPLAAPSFSGYKQVSPQSVVGSHYRLPLQPLQASAPNKPQFTLPQSIYAGNIKSLSPQPVKHSQFHGTLLQLPALVQNYNHPGKSFHYGSNIIHNKQQPVTPNPPATQQQSSSNKAVYSNSQSEEQHHTEDDTPKFQRAQETPREVNYEEEHSEPNPIKQSEYHSVSAEQKVPVRETTITSVLNGKKTRVNFITKPPLPLLDISLLEPLTFENPLVPQVQHFLPKISSATYHKLPEFNANVNKKQQKPKHKINNYDNENEKVKPKKITPKKKQRYPQVDVQNSFYDEKPSASTVRPVVTVKETSNENPEFSYEINSPNYKETYKEQAIKYNKETQSEPVHYTYGSQKHEEPVHYTYVHSSKEPVNIKELHYEIKGEKPKHIIHKFNSEGHDEENKKDKPDSEESSEDDGPPHHHNDHHDYNNQHHENHQHLNNNHNNQREHEYQHPVNKQQSHQSLPHHLKPEHREEEYHPKPSPGSLQNQHDDKQSFKPIQYYTKTSSGTFQPISEYEEEIRIAAPIKVNPSQHLPLQSEPTKEPQQSLVTQQHNHPPSESHSNPGHVRNSEQHHGSEPHHNSEQHHGSEPHHNSDLHHGKHHTPAAHVQQKTKSIIIQEEMPEHSDGNHMMFIKEVDNEKDFEKAYNNAAFGFPAYGKAIDVERDIYNPESYGVSREYSDFDIKNSPFQQYHEESNNFPKNSRLSYKDTKDKTKENYFLDYSISKPESLSDRYQKKTDYYKLFKQQKPEKYIAHDVNDERQKKQKASETYSAYNFFPTQNVNNMKQLFAQYKMTPFVQELDYSKGLPRDNTAFSTQPYHRYKSNTFFVEPQFQYGFEPISIPRLLDSELATMASNDSPESENPGMRKKIYKENFYINKTSVSDAGPS